MACCLDVYLKSSSALDELKVRIKQWESTFLLENGRKPNKKDVDDAPDNIRGIYKQYWKARNLTDRSSATSDPPMGNDAWSSALNKSNLAKQKKTSAGLSDLEYFSKKLKHEALATVPLVKTRYSTHGLRRSVFTENNVLLTDGEVTTRSHHNQKSPLPFDKNIGEENSQKNIGEESSQKNIDEANSKKDIGEENSQKNIGEENMWKDVDVPKTVDLFKKRFIITKPEKSSQNFKKINILSSPLTDMSSKKRNIGMNVNHDWLESCAVINDHKGSPDPLASGASFNGQVSKLALGKPESARGTGADADVNVINTGVKEDSSELKTLKSLGHSDVGSRTLSSDFECRISPAVEICYSSSAGCSVKADEMSADFDHTNETCVTETMSTIQSANMPVASDISEKCAKEEYSSEYNEGVSFSTKRLSVKRKFCDPINHEEVISKGHSTLKSDTAKHLAKKPCKKSPASVSDNYIRINLKKKVFVRGHRRINVRRMKYQKWKEHKKRSGNSGKTLCFKCGKSGHWARSCTASKETDLLSGYDDTFESPLPTIGEVAGMTKNCTVNDDTNRGIPSGGVNDKELTTDCVHPETISEAKSTSNQDFPLNQTILPLYDTTSDGKTQDTPNEVFKGLKKMGYSEFRAGQEKTVMRILSGLSTLFVSPTGSGKSLCYQLPAYIYAQKYNCISLVISPLVSLMEDQVTGLPSCLHAVCLHSGMSDAQKEAAVTTIMRGKAQILLISPEAVIRGKLSGSISFSKLPPVAFVCIDEAHCLSEWSHNFRPSYLQLLKVLTDRMNVKCVLGLTATATRSIVKNIADHLKLKETDESIIGETSVPPNLLLTVSRDKDKDWALIQLLKEDRFCNCYSILIYCSRREETERIAMLIRTSLQQESFGLLDEGDKEKSQRTKKKAGKWLRWSAEAYHAGLRPQKRKSVQKNFMAGKLHIVVATIAFGMGLDKADVRAVIHYNIPKSFENYVQEIGRAGRDGLHAQCHVFLDCEGGGLWELRRHVYSNSVDRRTLRKLLQKVFLPCKCYEKKPDQSQSDVLLTDDVQLAHQNTQTCMKHERMFPIAETVQELDLKEETITTLLCYLELHSSKWVEVLSSAYATCSVRCYGGPQQMKTLTHKCPIIAAAIALDEQCGKQWNGSNEYQFHIADVASHMSWESSAVKKGLKQLEWTQTNGRSQKTGVIIEFSDLAFHLRARGDLESDELDAMLDFLCERVKTQEQQELQRLNYVFSTFRTCSFSNYWSCVDTVSQQRSEVIKEKVKQYFEENVSDEQLHEQSVLDCPEKVSIPEIRQHIRDFVNIHSDHSFTGRAVARIFQGISSPCYPSEVWGRVRRFWRSYLNVDFNLLLKIANEEIFKLRS